MAKRPSAADGAFLGVVGAKVNKKRAGKQLNSGVPTKTRTSRRGMAKDYVTFAGSNHGMTLAAGKGMELAGNESSIRTAQENVRSSKKGLDKTIGTWRKLGADSKPIERVARRFVGRNPSRLEAAADRGVRIGYQGAASVIQDAANAGARDAVTLGNLRPEQFQGVIDQQSKDFSTAKKTAKRR